MHLDELARVVACVRSEQTIAVDSESGKRAAAITLAARESARGQREIRP